MAKYFIENSDINFYESTSFYFFTDLVEFNSDNMTKYIDWDGVFTKAVDFKIKNYSNKLLYSSSDINYILNVSNESNLFDINIVDSNGENVNDTKLKINGDSVNENNYKLIISPKGSVTNGVYDVILNINSVSPYSKNYSIVLKNFIDGSSSNFKYEIYNSSNNEYKLFRFIFSKETNDLVLSYDNSKLLVDRSLLLLSGINPYDGILEIPKSKFRVGEYYEIIRECKIN